MHGVLCVDETGEPLSRVLTWMDRRSSAIADAWRTDGTAAELYREIGAPILPLAKLRWLAQNEPDLFRRTHRFVGLKELFVHRWTGEWLIDWGSLRLSARLSLTIRLRSPCCSVIMFLLTMMILPDTRSLTRFGAAATAGSGMADTARWVVVVVVVVSVTQLPLGRNAPSTHAPQYGLCGPTASPVCVCVVWVVCVVSAPTVFPLLHD